MAAQFAYSPLQGVDFAWCPSCRNLPLALLAPIDTKGPKQTLQNRDRMPIGVPLAYRLTWWHVRETFQPNISALRLARLAAQRIAIVPCANLFSDSAYRRASVGAATGARLAIDESAQKIAAVTTLAKQCAARN